jgi:phage N-6-adenine-methyltransferase
VSAVDVEAGAAKADAGRLGYVGAKPAGRKSNDWFTPVGYLDSARVVLQGIDLDPFSSEEANGAVKAHRFYTEEDDAFRQDWTARTIWMNPPYSGKLVAEATGRFMDEFGRGSFRGGIVLVNNATETRWFQRALREAAAVCFTDHRISFWSTDGKNNPGANTRGQAFILFGVDYLEAFEAEFSKYGKVVLL